MDLKNKVEQKKKNEKKNWGLARALALFFPAPHFFFFRPLICYLPLASPSLSISPPSLRSPPFSSGRRRRRREATRRSGRGVAETAGGGEGELQQSWPTGTARWLRRGGKRAAAEGRAGPGAAAAGGGCRGDDGGRAGGESCGAWRRNGGSSSGTARGGRCSSGAGQGRLRQHASEGDRKKQQRWWPTTRLNEVKESASWERAGGRDRPRRAAIRWGFSPRR